MRLPDRLPSLAGRAGAVVQGVYLVVAALVVATILAGAFFDALKGFRDISAATHYGLKLGNNDQAQGSVASENAAAKAMGVPLGDRIAAIDGAPLPPRSTATDVGARLVHLSGPLVLDTVDAAGRTTRHTLPRTENLDQAIEPTSGLPLGLAGAILVVEALAIPLILVSISLLLTRNRPRDPEAMLLAFGFLLLAYGLSHDAWLWQLHLPLPIPAVNWVESVLGVLGYWAMFVGLCAFPDGRFPTRWAQYAWMVPTTYVLANAATNFVLWSNRAATLALDVPIFIAVVTPVLLRFRRSPQGVQRQQIKWALFGGVIMILAALTGAVMGADQVAALLGHPARYLFDLLPNNVIALAFPLGLLVSLLRYRLYDADTVITRSTVYAVLAVALVAVFACTEKVIELLGEEYFGHRLRAMAGGLGAAISAVMVAPLHHRISHWVEHRFRHDLLHLRESVPPLVANLRETASPAELADAVLHRVMHALHAASGAVVADDGHVFATHHLSGQEVADWQHRWRQRRHVDGPIDHADPLLPIHIPLAVEDAKPVGWLLLGARPDGSLYGKDERDTLAEIAEPLAHGLMSALHRESRLAAQDQERALFVGRLESLEQAMASLSQRIAAMPSAPS